jgi:hypothetical protein
MSGKQLYDNKTTVCLPKLTPTQSFTFLPQCLWFRYGLCLGRHGIDAEDKSKIVRIWANTKKDNHFSMFRASLLPFFVDSSMASIAA